MKHLNKKDEAVYEEGFPKVVYHKDFDAHGDEKQLLKYSKVVKDQAAHDKLGSDWGPHPSEKKEEKKAEKYEAKIKLPLKSDKSE